MKRFKSLKIQPHQTNQSTVSVNARPLPSATNINVSKIKKSLIVNYIDNSQPSIANEALKTKSATQIGESKTTTTSPPNERLNISSRNRQIFANPAANYNNKSQVSSSFMNKNKLLISASKNNNNNKNNQMALSTNSTTATSSSLSPTMNSFSSSSSSASVSSTASSPTSSTKSSSSSSPYVNIISNQVKVGSIFKLNNPFLNNCKSIINLCFVYICICS